MNTAKLSPRPRNRKQKDDIKQEIVVQVHKPIKSTTSSENDFIVHPEDNQTYQVEDKNENYNTVNMPVRDISVDSGSQINSKIISLIETEMKKDIKHSHFTDSRPQSLSFYEDEKIPEELSGNLELLSPEERKHYRKRKEYLQMDTDEMNTYNVIQDLYTRESDEILTSSGKKSKSRKKRHGESEMGMGDSREMMIPKEKRKSKKKKRENSPVTSANNNNKRKHKKRDEDYEPKNEITVALEELQDDVFETGNSEEFIGVKAEKMKKSPRRSDKLYVQKKSKFEATSKTQSNLNRQGAQDFEEFAKKNLKNYPLDVAIRYQYFWIKISNLCHGLLSGLALGHWLYIVCNQNYQDRSFLVHYAYYSDIYTGLFYTLCIFCIVSVLDRIDIAHVDNFYLSELLKTNKFNFVVVVYIFCLVVHLSAATYDDKLALMSYGNETDSNNNITVSEINTWNHLSLWRTILAFVAWLFVGLGPSEDMLYIHIKNLEKYLPGK